MCPVSSCRCMDGSRAVCGRQCARTSRYHRCTGASTSCFRLAARSANPHALPEEGGGGGHGGHVDCGGRLGPGRIWASRAPSARSCPVRARCPPAWAQPGARLAPEAHERSPLRGRLRATGSMWDLGHVAGRRAGPPRRACGGGPEFRPRPIRSRGAPSARLGPARRGRAAGPLAPEFGGRAAGVTRSGSGARRGIAGVRQGLFAPWAWVQPWGTFSASIL